MSRPAPKILRGVRVPYYEQLKVLLLKEIKSEGMKPGDMLPSESEMCERYEVSRTVVRQAIGELVNEGVLLRQHGKGTFIAHTKVREQFMQSTVGFFEDLSLRGHSVKSKVISCQLVEAGNSVAQALEIEPGSTCTEVTRLRYVNKELVVFTKSYINSGDHNLVADLLDSDLSVNSLYRTLEDHWGLRIESGRRSLEVVSASGMLPGILEIKSDSPVLYIESVGRDASGRPIEFFQAWHRIDRTRLEMDVVRRK
ncbi:GntR family transcriptional regulator [Arthrobacter sp. KN11-1C]|uniref:GntR family transcriptional regulator n=1 Tax=Arthrobacter sp. KN11-1C TaxID=3445774 RepID=UPI003FA04097